MRALLLTLLLATVGCRDRSPAPEVPFADRIIDAERMARAFPSDRVKDREGWATDLHVVFAAHKIPASNGNTCAVVATLEQESGYKPDPAVPGIGGMIDAWIAEKQAPMGKIPGWAFQTGLRAVLDTKAPGAKKSWYERLQSAETERDVDVAFREFVAFQRSKLPEPLRAAESAAQVIGLDLDDFNPITTAGCMQVKVDFAEDHARSDGTERALVRDALYTRAGCLHYGTVRLLGYDAGYDAPIYRFADYNAGYFASRNAAFQEQVAALSGASLALDGDLLRYNDKGRPAAEASQTLTAVRALVTTLALPISDARVERDLTKEKTRAFEETETWTRIRSAYQEKSGKEPAYARLPDVTLDSIKLAGKKTTAWFAGNVDKRHAACMTRLRGK